MRFGQRRSPILAMATGRPEGVARRVSEISIGRPKG